MLSNKFFPVLLVVASFFLPSMLYLGSSNFLGYDSYYFLAEVCGGNPIYDAPSNAPLHDVVLSALPCNDFLLKLLLVVLLGLSMLIIYAIGEDYSKGWGKYTTLFAMVSPILIYNSFKFENDAFAFPIIYLATFFFLRHLREKQKTATTFLKVKKNYVYLFLTLACLTIATLFWGGSFYTLLFFSLFEPILFLITIPLLFVFGSPLFQSALPRFDVNENNPLQGMLSVLFFIGQLVFPRTKRVFNFPYFWLTMFFVVFGLINPKFMILALPLIGLALANAFNLASVDGKQKMLLVASICIIGFSLPIGLGSLHPNSIEHEAVQDLVNLGVDENKVLFNDWSYGHMVYYYGGETNQRASPDRQLDVNNSFENVLVLTRHDLNCGLIKKYDAPSVIGALKLYRC